MDAVVRGRRVQPLTEILDEQFRDRAYRDDLAKVLGSSDNEVIERYVADLTREQLGARYGGALFASKGSGVVFGIVLESGERAVLKLFSPSASEPGLAAMQRLMAELAVHQYPAPRARSELFQTSSGTWAAFYAYLDGDQRNAHEPVVRRELARSLAELTSLLAPLEVGDLPHSPPRLEAPRTQRPGREVDPDEKEARFIDEHAESAQRTIQNSKLQRVAVHLAWGVRNVRFRDNTVCAVYDWTSLHAASEAECAGRAAAHFTAQWDMPALLTPTPDEAKAFLDEYQAARGRRFSRAERAVAAAAARYLVAHVARLELESGIPEGDNFRGLLSNYDSAPLL